MRSVRAIESGKVAGRASTCRRPRGPPADDRSSLEPVLATSHIGGSTGEAQEIVGVRIVEQVVEDLQRGVAVNAVNSVAVC